MVESIPKKKKPKFHKICWEQGFVITDDPWLWKLFLGQREIKTFEITRTKIGSAYDDEYLRYYFGYAITNKELAGILEYQSQYKRKKKKLKKELITECIYMVFHKNKTILELADNQSFRSTISKETC